MSSDRQYRIQMANDTRPRGMVGGEMFQEIIQTFKTTVFIVLIVGCNMLRIT